MMWQKARIVNTNHSPQLIGRHVWVKAEPPHQARNIVDAISGLRVPAAPAFHLAITSDQGTPIIGANRIELLPEFAEDVPLVTWEEFLNGADAESGEKR